VVAELQDNVRSLLGLPDNYHVLFLQGGATQQFTMAPMTLLAGRANPAEYLHTGYWSGKALPEARRQGQVRVLWSGERHGYDRLPTDDELAFAPDAPYLHYVSNETVEGLQFHRVLGRDDVPRICDMSSDFLSAPGDFSKFSLIYAHAQKNIGPAGVTVVVMKDELLKDAPAPGVLPGFLDYHEQIKASSILNTPPVFAIYVVLLVTRWLRGEIGGLTAMGRINAAKADLLYRQIDDSGGFYQAHAARPDRSTMNVTFRLPTPELHYRFIEMAARAGLSGLSGHRSIGGIRASLYNGMQLAAVEKLVEVMRDFQSR
jgi:phosphoserine aminotransferase